MIKKELLAQIILDWQKEKLPNITERNLKIDLEIPIKRAITILGPRRCGKTYYLYSLIEKLLAHGVEKERILYINFEHPKLVGMSLNDLSLLLETFYELCPQNRNRKIWLFFDEIQNIKNWEMFIRSVLDRSEIQVFLSGSSSKLLSQEIATSLRGRTLSYLLLPFSFSEFLAMKNLQYKKYLPSGEKEKILNVFRKYFDFGGYPETIIYSKEKERIINEIMEVTVYRDLIERHRIRNIKAVRLMFNYLVKAKEFSVHKFYRFLKSININIGKNSLYNYLEFFQDAFVIFPLRKFSLSLKKAEQSLPKIYVIDNSFISQVVGDDKGKKMENLVFLGLLGRGYQVNKDIFYYKNGLEIDFLIKEKNRVKSLIQSCYDIEDYITKEREVKSLLKASRELRCGNLEIITFDYESEKKIEGKKIKFIPLWKWLLINN